MIAQIGDRIIVDGTPLGTPRRTGVVITVADPTDLHAVDALTADGGVVTIRAARRSDRRALARLYGEATPESLRLRFFEQPSAATLAAEVDHLCWPETARHQSILAFDGTDLVGVASFQRTDDTGHRAEFSVFVAEAHRGRGIGTLLLEHLRARARRRGISELIGKVLWDNIAMLRVARNLSSPASQRFSHGVVEVRLAARGTEAPVRTRNPAVRSTVLSGRVRPAVRWRAPRCGRAAPG